MENISYSIIGEYLDLYIQTDIVFLNELEVFEIFAFVLNASYILFRIIINHV